MSKENSTLAVIVIASLISIVAACLELSSVFTKVIILVALIYIVFELINEGLPRLDNITYMLMVGGLSILGSTYLELIYLNKIIPDRLVFGIMYFIICFIIVGAVFIIANVLVKKNKEFWIKVVNTSTARSVILSSIIFLPSLTLVCYTLVSKQYFFRYNLYLIALTLMLFIVLYIILTTVIQAGVLLYGKENKFINSIQFQLNLAVKINIIALTSFSFSAVVKVLLVVLHL